MRAPVCARAMSMCSYVRSCPFGCVRAGCVHARVCERVYASACACVRAFPSDCILARVCAPRGCMRTAIARRRHAVFIARPAPARRRPRARGCVRGHRPGSRALAAGVNWTSRTASAPWAGRAYHTSVVDAAGAIYVLGGVGGYGSTLFNDVWASTDGGARPDGVQGGVVGGTLDGTPGVP